MRILLFIALPFLIISNPLFCQNEQDSSSIPAFHYLKTSTSILAGEVPLYWEIRKNNDALELSVGYIFANIIPGSQKYGCTGFKVSAGTRRYFKKSAGERSTFYINPQFFFKSLWSQDRHYSQDGPFIYGGGDNYERYMYDLYRKVFALKLNFGWSYVEPGRAGYEFFMGVSYRRIEDVRDRSVWYENYISSPYHFGYISSTPTRYVYDSSLWPGLHMGFIFTFPLKKN